MTAISSNIFCATHFPASGVTKVEQKLIIDEISNVTSVFLPPLSLSHTLAPLQHVMYLLSYVSRIIWQWILVHILDLDFMNEEQHLQNASFHCCGRKIITITIKMNRSITIHIHSDQSSFSPSFEDCGVCFGYSLNAERVTNVDISQNSSKSQLRNSTLWFPAATAVDQEITRPTQNPATEGMLH